MSENDFSHDVDHVFRVRDTALHLARDDTSVDKLVLEVTALLHDLYDHKYSSEPGTPFITSFLRDLGVDEHRISEITTTVERVGYSYHKTDKSPTTRELDYVRDADYLDAIGAIGVLRVAGYSATHSVPLFGASSSCVSHFHEKLLRLPGMCVTPAAKVEANRRVEFMKVFLRQLDSEVSASLEVMR